MQHSKPLEINNLAISEFESNSSFKVQVPVFEIKTCQRTLFLYAVDSEYKTILNAFSRRHFEGIEAYEYLLRFACGLESEIKGETDVFGQVKMAYKNLLKNDPSLASFFKNIFLALFEDTKEVRSQHLRGIGGNTYGALARRLINPTENDQVLVIGAGDICKSVAPYFADFSLKIWNRSADRLTTLKTELEKKGHSPTLFTSEVELVQAISTATIILIATPFGSPVETLVHKNLNPNTKILHLGAQSNEVNTLPFIALSLSDLFAIEKGQSEMRYKQVNQAIHACHERSLLRGLSKSISLAHGWEDLAVFF